MNRKMTLLALPLNCCGLGDSGLGVAAGAPGMDATALLPKKPARSSRADSATPVKPAPACHRNSRRVRPQKVLEGRMLTGVRLVQCGPRVGPLLDPLVGGLL